LPYAAIIPGVKVEHLASGILGWKVRPIQADEANACGDFKIMPKEKIDRLLQQPSPQKSSLSDDECEILSERGRRSRVE
jgi:hypothetical protein